MGACPVAFFADQPSSLLNCIMPSTTKVRWNDFECHDFGDDEYAIPKFMPTQSGNTHDEDSKIKNLIHTSDLSKHSGFGRGGMEWKKPPPGYVCHRCNVPGQFIQHCPTNGDPNYDIKKMMLMATPSGINAGVLKPGFPKEVEGLSSSSSRRVIPPELHCPLCKGLMKMQL
ncbi:E3 ubiquitin-protein ligase rbbp6 [Datura stramonium]|uniref:E3 ubiquitin-protein ligase rbbp6 n=1 Tax=Datura stramonium TaxID=4076 RepID=A0ABS8TCU4_DATST|nr:E3 ubiquitin-protein ligase rbbp6 [Datura stramonium]